MDDPGPAADTLLGPGRERLDRYAQLLAGPGIERGLLGPREVERLWSRHLLNCAAVAPLIGAGERVVDVGAGAGLPGIVLACVRPDLEVVLVEPMARRSVFLQECVQALGLEGVSVLRRRAEEVHGTVVGSTVTARAVAPLDRLLTVTLPLVRPGGQLLALKGRGAPDELAAAAPALRKWSVEEAEVLTCGADLLATPATVVRVRLGSTPIRRAVRGRQPRRRGARR